MHNLWFLWIYICIKSFYDHMCQLINIGFIMVILYRGFDFSQFEFQYQDCQRTFNEPLSILPLAMNCNVSCPNYKSAMMIILRAIFISSFRLLWFLKKKKPETIIKNSWWIKILIYGNRLVNIYCPLVAYYAIISSLIYCSSERWVCLLNGNKEFGGFEISFRVI